jgi:hypothetical protein
VLVTVGIMAEIRSLNGKRHLLIRCYVDCKTCTTEVYSCLRIHLYKHLGCCRPDRKCGGFTFRTCLRNQDVAHGDPSATENLEELISVLKECMWSVSGLSLWSRGSILKVHRYFALTLTFLTTVKVQIERYFCLCVFLMLAYEQF